MYKSKKFYNLLTELGNETRPASERDSLIDTVTSDQMKGLQCVTRGVLKNRIPVQEKEVNILRPYEKSLKKFCGGGLCGTLKQKRQFLKQKGGFFPFLVPIIAKAAIGGIVATAAGSATKGLLAKNKRR